MVYGVYILAILDEFNKETKEKRDQSFMSKREKIIHPRFFVLRGRGGAAWSIGSLVVTCRVCRACRANSWTIRASRISRISSNRISRISNNRGWDTSSNLANNNSNSRSSSSNRVSRSRSRISRVVLECSLLRAPASRWEEYRRCCRRHSPRRNLTRSRISSNSNRNSRAPDRTWCRSSPRWQARALVAIYYPRAKNWSSWSSDWASEKERPLTAQRRWW